MSETSRVTVTANDRTASFLLTFDDSFESDRDMRLVISRDGACEPEVVHLLHRVLKPGDIAIDGGANVGFFTCLMSQLVGPDGLVFAVEPAPANIRKLEHNLANNKTTNVRVVKSPLSSSIHEVTLHLAPHSGFNSLAPSNHTVGKMTMVSTTIDAMLNGMVPKLIKLDIEGAELQALEGACIAFTYCSYIVVEMHNESMHRFGSSQQLLRQFMAEREFDMFVLHADGHIPLMVPRDTVVKSTRPNLMVLFSTPAAVAEAWPVLELT